MAGMPRTRFSGLFVAALLFVFISFPSGALAEKSVRWDTVGEWDIRIDQSLDYGCFMAAVYESGTALRIGWSPLDETVYVMVANGDWKSIKNNSTYEIEFQFGDLQPWVADATGSNSDGFPALMFTVGDPDFIREMSEQSGLKISYQGEEIDRVELTDSHKALASMIECQKTVTSFDEEQNTDPFKEDSDDPFAR